MQPSRMAPPVPVIELAVEPVPVGSLQLNNHAQFVGTASIDLRSRGLKRRLSTPTIFDIAARVPVHSGMHGSPVGLSVNHPCMHAVHMNP